MNKIRLYYILGGIFLLLFWTSPVLAADEPTYKETPEYQFLRDSMHNAFNTGDSSHFFVAVKALEDYLLKQGDLHAYYTQRCNEIVFQLNRQRVFEAYKLATELSKELTERKLDKEMYMAINMMGHIYRYSGNKESAKQCFWEVIRRMEKEGYIESQSSIYMNLVNIYMDEDPKEALKLIDKAASIASKTRPERLFDIEARRTLAYYVLNDKERFLKGYQAYKEGEEKGLTSVHGRTMEIYYLASQGKTDEAIQLAAEIAEDPYETQADIYAKAGRWEEAFKALKLGAEESDSINSVILSSSMQDIQRELRLYEMKRQSERRRFYAMIAIASLLLLLVIALVYIVQSRRRHLSEMKDAYQKILESDKMKTAFIQNVSHEVRTPLNIISGFAQVLAIPNNNVSQEERRHIADTMMHNTRIITTMINEVLDMSDSESANTLALVPMPCNEVLKKVIKDFCKEMVVPEERLRFETTLNDDFTILTQEVLLKRIITPLLDNAVKNTKEGDIVIKTTASDSQLQIMVEDKGSGIPAKEAEHIFERFVKLDTFKQGLGLGLTFSRMMARRIGGDVVLDTMYSGSGARFVVKLPI
ncbi:MAG: HAMP domain-containing histidine kinase [Prevotella sp.]|nr:HAMP domain-containing histidine kinase [Prevotella sp.]MBR3080101.1 HAMP domain-containing histidine kinase [Prevotella sp.]